MKAKIVKKRSVKKEKKQIVQIKGLVPELTLGIVGHVDHGKTTLTEALTGKWSSVHSEELKRGITIRLGYADSTFYFCESCQNYSVSEKCLGCFSDTKPKRAISIVDVPGHETLMATVLSGASLMDGAIMVIAANERCPQPQTAEHLKVLDIVGIKKIVIIQSKIDLISEEKAIQNYEEIKNFVKGTVAENAPIIPISAINKANIDMLIEAVENYIPTPDRKLDQTSKFFVARSFDVNKPGTAIEDLVGGVLGGSLTQGVLKEGEEIEIRPGGLKPIRTKITGIKQGTRSMPEAKPGCLIALETELDPALTKGDMLVGNIAGSSNLPPIWDALKLKVELFDHVIGVEGSHKIEQIKTGDTLLLTSTIAKTLGVVTSSYSSTIETKLKLRVCADKNDKVAIAARVGGRWHLIGYGVIL